MDLNEDIPFCLECRKEIPPKTMVFRLNEEYLSLTDPFVVVHLECLLGFYHERKNDEQVIEKAQTSDGDYIWKGKKYKTLADFKLAQKEDEILDLKRELKSELEEKYKNIRVSYKDKKKTLDRILKLDNEEV